MSLIHEYDCVCCGQYVWCESSSLQEHDEHGMCKPCFDNPYVRICQVIVNGKVEDELPVNLKSDADLREQLMMRYRESTIEIKPVDYVLDIIADVTDYIQDNKNIFNGYPFFHLLLNTDAKVDAHG